MTTDSTETAYRAAVAGWLQLYPPRWRAERGEEVLGVLLDTRPDSARAPDLRTRLDLLVGALLYRWRTHPPLGPWLAWRVWEVRLPDRHLAWGHDDATGSWAWLRNLLSLPLAMVAVLLVSGGSFGHVLALALLLVMLPVGYLSRSSLRRRRLQCLAGDQPPLPEPGRALVPRVRYSTGRWLWWPVTALVTGLVAVAAVVVVVRSSTVGTDAVGSGLAMSWAVLLSGDGMFTLALLPPLAVLATIPWTFSPFVRPSHRLRRRPDQPNRGRLVDPPWWLLVAASGVLLLSPLALLPWLLGTGGHGLFPLLSAPALWFGAAAALARLGAARAERRHPGPPVALVDVLSWSGWDQIPVDQPESRWVGHPSTVYLAYPPEPGTPPRA